MNYFLIVVCLTSGLLFQDDSVYIRFELELVETSLFTNISCGKLYSLERYAVLVHVAHMFNPFRHVATKLTYVANENVCSGATKPLSTTTTQATTVSIPITQVINQRPTAPQPPQICPEATTTFTPLGKLRSAMRNASYTRMSAYFDAFIVFYSDEHLSEDPSPEERRLEYISSWDGVGTAVVLADGGAAIWVPSGEVRRARTTLSCAWLIFDADDLSQTSIPEWITQERPSARRNDRAVGGDSRLTSVNEWALLSSNLQREGMQLFHAPYLVDTLWDEETDLMRKRPEFSRIVANLHHPEYIGVTWREKVAAVRNELRLIGVDAMVVTALDEVAWLLNIRGRDLPYAPLLKAFVIVSTTDFRVYTPAGKLSMPVREALSAYNCYANTNTALDCTKVNEYAAIYTDLRRPTESKILIPTSGTFQRGASAAIGQTIPQSKRVFQPSPIIYLKAQKNPAEIKGMHRAHLRDAVAMCTVLSYLESKAKANLNEQTVSMTVDATRATQAGYVGLSMQTRVAFGPNAAEPEYRATNATNRRIFTNATLVIQSGGQYDEGTTVVTRTVHYGTPSREERKAYTSVLRSLAALSMLQTPMALPAAHTDPVARAPLWNFKQDYIHPTGYGVGAALSRREDPVVIDYRQDTNLHTFREGYFITSEPAWYQTNKFGIKLGNILEVILQQGGYLGFQEATLIPFEPKLIDKHQLTEYEITWLNAYNERIRKTVGPELHDQGLIDVYYWMMNKTIRIESPRAKKYTNSSAISYTSRLEIIVISVITFIISINN